MAKLSKSVSFKNAIIDLEGMKIIEITKDESFEYDLLSVLKDWNGIEGVSLNLKTDDELPLMTENNKGD